MTGAGGAAAGAASGRDGLGGAAANGGSTSMAGAGGAATIEAPQDCQSTSQGADATRCNYVYSCGGQTHFDDCSLDSGGVWSCDCGTFSTETRYFEIEGVGALDACGTIARVCESGDLSVSSTQTCRTLERTNDGYACTAHDTCGNVVDFDVPSGVVVRAVEHYRASCEPTQSIFDTDPQFRCSCQGVEANGFGTLTSARSVDDLCDPFLRYCRREQDPPFSDRVCGYTAPFGNVEQSCPMNPKCQGCSIGQQCAMAAPIGDGVSIIDEQDAVTHSIDCVSQTGTLRCVCDSTDALYGDEMVPQSILDVCSGMLDVCPP
jgi:hypothetical protein